MRNPEETKRRLLEAATAEFSTYGIAGARVDRIAETAGCNKQSIYSYFGSKEGLFDAVIDAIVVQTVSTVPVDPYDLPGYAGRLFDWYSTRPEVLRLANWIQLERGNINELSKTVALASAEKLRKIKEAQEAGAITRTIPAEYLMVLVARLSTAKLDYCNLDKTESAALRAAMVEAVRRLVAP
jgi:AcrR family transcriptional regulator